MAPGGVEPPHAASKAAALSAELRGRAGDGGVTDGTRTHNHRDHNPGLYQLSYGHRAADSLARPLLRLGPLSLGKTAAASDMAGAAHKRSPRSALPLAVENRHASRRRADFRRREPGDTCAWEDSNPRPAA